MYANGKDLLRPPPLPFPSEALRWLRKLNRQQGVEEAAEEIEKVLRALFEEQLSKRRFMVLVAAMGRAMVSHGVESECG